MFRRRLKMDSIVFFPFCFHSGPVLGTQTLWCPARGSFCHHQLTFSLVKHVYQLWTCEPHSRLLNILIQKSLKTLFLKQEFEENKPGLEFLPGISSSCSQTASFYLSEAATNIMAHCAHYYSQFLKVVTPTADLWKKTLPSPAAFPSPFSEEATSNQTWQTHWENQARNEDEHFRLSLTFRPVEDWRRHFQCNFPHQGSNFTLITFTGSVLSMNVSTELNKFTSVFSAFLKNI